MNYDRLTDVDIERYKLSIEEYKNKKKLFLIFGIILTILFVLMLGGGIALVAISTNTEPILVGPFVAGTFLLSFFFLPLGGAIALFVLRGTLLEKKIRNREFAIKQYEKLNQ